MSSASKQSPLIRVKNLYKVFGPNDKKVVQQVKDGASKDEILAKTGHTVGLSDINLDIFLVKFL